VVVKLWNLKIGIENLFYWNHFSFKLLFMLRNPNIFNERTLFFSQKWGKNLLYRFRLKKITKRYIVIPPWALLTVTPCFHFSSCKIRRKSKLLFISIQNRHTCGSSYAVCSTTPIIVQTASSGRTRTRACGALFLASQRSLPISGAFRRRTRRWISTNSLDLYGKQIL